MSTKKILEVLNDDMTTDDEVYILNYSGKDLVQAIENYGKLNTTIFATGTGLVARVENLEDNLDKIQLGTIQSDLKTYLGNDTTFATKIEQLETNINNLFNDIGVKKDGDTQFPENSLQRKADDLQAIAEENRRIINEDLHLRATQQNLTDAVNEINKQLTFQVNGTDVSIEDKIAAIDSNISKMSETIIKANELDSKKDLWNGYDSRITLLDSSITALGDRLDALNYNSINTSVENLEDIVLGPLGEGDVRTNGLRSRVESLEAKDIATLTADVATLKTTITTNNIVGRVNGLEELVGSENTTTGLVPDITTLKNAVLQSSNGADSLESKYTALKNTVVGSDGAGGLQSQVKTLEKTVLTSEGETTSLEYQVNALTGRMTEVEGRLGVMKKTYDSSDETTNNLHWSVQRDIAHSILLNYDCFLGIKLEASGNYGFRKVQDLKTSSATYILTLTEDLSFSMKYSVSETDNCWQLTLTPKTIPDEPVTMTATIYYLKLW